MAPKNTKATAPDPTDAPEPSASDHRKALDKFSKELAERFPNRIVRRFEMPTNSHRKVREVCIIEITSRDEVTAAINADATMSLVEKNSIRLTNDAERREAIRLSIVGFGEALIGQPIAYRHTNNDGEMLTEITDWPAKAMTAVHAFFGVVNGVPSEEVASGIMGALTVGAFAPPTSEIPSAAEPGK